jgi:TfoX/Sxy family transcriptional regulator of competence genes
MAYNEKLGDRCREIIAQTEQNVAEKKMFGGLCFMINDKMCLGIVKDELMLRLDPNLMEELLEEEGCRAMDFTGKSMKGFVYVSEDVLHTRKKLERWINLALDFNPIAKASPKKKK